MPASKRNGLAQGSRESDFASLPSDLVHAVASALDDKDRCAEVAVCCASRPAAARPDAAVLPPTLLAAAAAKCRWAMMGTCKAWFEAIEAVPDLWPVFTIKLGSTVGVQQLEQLADLSRAAWRVRLCEAATGAREVRQMPAFFGEVPASKLLCCLML